MKKYILSFLVMGLFTLSSCAQDKKDYLLDATSFKKEIGTHEGQLIDIRTAAEFEEATIEGAINIDFLEDDFKAEISKIDKATPVYIFCKSGGRSAKAYDLLKEEGFENVFELEGGFKAWEEDSAKE